nr:histidinol-phosphate aminotransferase family protein [SAR324 cluster bacterium]
MSYYSPQKSIKVRDAISRMSFYNPPIENRNPEENLLMDFNETPLPPPPKLIEKIAAFLSKHIHTYPLYGDLLERLGEYAE